MSRFVLPVLFTILVWWAGTGALLWINRLPARAHAASFVAFSLLAIAALGGLWASSASATVAGAYCAFTCTIAIWAWQELAFLLGYLTGPRRTVATPALAGWARAEEAFRAVSHHEVTLLVLGAVVAIATWNQPNRAGLWTFVVLWTMRQSAKLNLFLGVRNLFEDFLPLRLQYLQSYFRRAAMNALFPWSVMASTAIAVPLWIGAAGTQDAAAAAGLALVGTLLALAILEHLFLVLPLPSERLWRWALRSR